MSKARQDIRLYQEGMLLMSFVQDMFIHASFPCIVCHAML